MKGGPRIQGIAFGGVGMAMAAASLALLVLGMSPTATAALGVGLFFLSLAPLVGGSLRSQEE
jgi:hypothetical protein